MSGVPEASPPNRDQYESVRDILPLLSRFKELKSFWKTREAVLGGEPLHELTKDDLKQRELMGPWKFNIVQSATSALVAACIAALFNFAREKATSGPAFETLPEFEAVYGIVEPFVIPFALLLTTFAIGRTIKPANLSKSAVRKARELLSRHYLYLDAAYGLFPQTMAALYPTLREVLNFTLILMAWQAVITLRVLPMDLYARGESFDQTAQLFKVEPKTQVPWRRYIVCVLIVIPILTIVLSVVAGFIALGISVVVHWWRVH